MSAISQYYQLRALSNLMICGLIIGLCNAEQSMLGCGKLSVQGAPRACPLTVSLL